MTVKKQWLLRRFGRDRRAPAAPVGHFVAGLAGVAAGAAAGRKSKTDDRAAATALHRPEHDVHVLKGANVPRRDPSVHVGRDGLRRDGSRARDHGGNMRKPRQEMLTQASKCGGLK